MKRQVPCIPRPLQQTTFAKLICGKLHYSEPRKSDGTFIADGCLSAYLAMLVEFIRQDWNYDDEDALDVVLCDLTLLRVETQ
jgi:hypothetical protein